MRAGLRLRLAAVPHDLTPWHAAYRWYRYWSTQGVWDDIHDALRDQVRRAGGRYAAPTAAVLDSQSTKSACGGEQIGFDAGKKVRGRKRHLLVDTCGLLLVCVVHYASIQDRAGARLVLYSIDEQYPTIGLIWLDGGYANSVDASLIDWADHELGVSGFGGVDRDAGHDYSRWFQNPMASRSSRTVPRPGWGSALRMRRRLMALGCP